MIDQLDIIIDKRLDEVSASNNPCFETAARLVAEEWAASEVSRLLDCFGSKFSGGSTFFTAEINGGEFTYGWVHDGAWYEVERGNDKASLLEYVGFGVESGK